MDYMTLKEAGQKWNVTPRQVNLFVFRRAYPRRCKDGWCLADPKERRKAD